MKKRFSVLVLTAVIALGGIGLAGIDTASAGSPEKSDSSVITTIKIKIIAPVAHLLGSTWS